MAPANRIVMPVSALVRPRAGTIHAYADLFPQDGTL